LKNGIRLWKIGVSIIKSELFNFLKQRRSDSEDPSGAASRCHFPEYNTEYFKQLTAEQLITRIVKGYPNRIWQKTRDRNEALDCRVYARAAAIALGIDRWSESKWEQLAGKNFIKTKIDIPGKESIKENSAQNSATKLVSKRPRIIRSSWL
jgi:phage terminase large subunit GpA-like protein